MGLTPPEASLWILPHVSRYTTWSFFDLNMYMFWFHVHFLFLLLATFFSHYTRGGGDVQTLLAIIHGCLQILLNLHFVLIYWLCKFLIAVSHHVQLIKTFKNYELQLSRAERHGFSSGGKCNQQVIKAVMNKTTTKK